MPYWPAIVAFARQWWKAAAGLIVGIMLGLPLGYYEGKSAGKAKADAARNAANVEQLITDAEANAAASDQRVADALAIVQAREELKDAVAKVPDSVPDAARVALGCARLQRAGTNTADLAACRGSESSNGQ